MSPTPLISTLSLHDALPISAGIRERQDVLNVVLCENQLRCSDLLRGYLRRHLDEEKLRCVGLVESVVSRMVPILPRSEEHTSELQSQSNLVCRLLLEKKKQK